MTKLIKKSLKVTGKLAIALLSIVALSSCISANSGGEQKDERNVSYQIKSPLIEVEAGIVKISVNVFIEGKRTKDFRLVKVLVEGDGDDFYLPLNSKGDAFTSIQELNIPKSFKVRTYFKNDYKSVTRDVSAEYRRTALLAKQGQMKIVNDGSIGLLHLKTENKKNINAIVRAANKTISKNITAYSKSVEKPNFGPTPQVLEIKKPILPDSPILNKGRFEKKADFQIRVQAQLDQRNAKIKELQSEYRYDVEKRNKKVEELTHIHQLKRDGEIAEYNQRLQKNIQGVNDVRRIETARVFADLMGKPYLEEVDYDVETSRIHAHLRLSKSKEIKNISVKVPLKQAKKMFDDPKSIMVSLTYQISSSDELLLETIALYYKGDLYAANITEQSFKAPVMQVKINANKLKLEDKQINIADFKIDEDKYLQNPNLVDKFQISAVAYVNNEERAVGKPDYDDDVLRLLKKSKGRKKSNKRWLFVIGIEKYQQTDNIKYSKRSAELFIKVAQKKLGITKRNTYALIDNNASVGAIKDRMRQMLKNVKKND